MATEDYGTLQEMLRSEDGITWLFTEESITLGVIHTKGYRNYTDYLDGYFNSTQVNGVSRKDDIVINTAISGADTNHMLRNLEPLMINKRPDVVFITYAMNNGRSKQVNLQKFKTNTQTIIDTARSIGAIPILQTEKYTTNAGNNKNLNQYYNVIRQLAIDNDTMLLDANMEFLRLNNNNPTGSTYLADWGHPNELGNLHWAHFILDSFDILEKDSALANLQENKVIVSKTGEDINPDNVATGLIGSTTQGDLVKSYEIGKCFNRCKIVINDEDASLYRNMTDRNITVRFKGGRPSGETTLFSFGDKNSTKKLNLKLLPEGKLRVSSNYGGEDQHYTCGRQVGDNQWHMVSINIKENRVRVYVDGVFDKDWDFTNYDDLLFDNFDINSVIVGGYRDINHPTGAGFFTGIIDYLDVYSRVLTEEEITGFSANRSSSEAANALRTYQIGKGFRNLGDMETRDEDADLYKDLTSSNITVRFKGTPTNGEATIFSLGDKNGRKMLTLRMLGNGQLRVYSDYGTEEKYYTFHRNVGDSNWHTVSLNLEHNRVVLYIDGQVDRNLDLTNHRNMTFNEFDINSLTIGGYRILGDTAGYFAEEIDYLSTTRY